MALLSREKLANAGRALLSMRRLITVVGLLLPIILFTAISYPELSENTLISDKALLPGLVDESWENHGELGAHVKKLQSETSPRKRADYVFDELSKANIEVYRQHFRSNITKTAGTNVFGIVRATRAISAEAMIVVVKLDKNQKQAISVALSIAKHSKSKSYWARDLIFLFVDGRDANVATLAWLQAYNGIDTGRYLWAEPLPAHSGTIIGGMVLDLSVSQFTHVQLQYIGVNGLLPNLDVFNLFVKLCEKYDVKVQVQDTDYRLMHDHIKAMWRGVFAQAFNELEGVHSILNHYRIHSVTIKAASDRYPRKQVRDMDSAALILEAALRSYNNLLEKFHRSYFFYYLSDPHKFASIAYYFPAIGAYLIALALNQYQGWIGSSNFKSQCSAWAQANIMAAVVYFAHIFAYNQYLQIGSQVHTQLAYWTDDQLAAFVLSLNVLWPWIAAAKITSVSERATVQYIHYGILTVILLSVGLLNPSIGVYLGTYLLLSTLISGAIPWNNFITRFLYNLLLNPITFHALIMVIASTLDYWPVDLQPLKLEDLSNPSKVATILLGEGQRLFESHLQHSAFNFLLFVFVSQQAHTVFISLIGW